MCNMVPKKIPLQKIVYNLILYILQKNDMI